MRNTESEQAEVIESVQEEIAMMRRVSPPLSGLFPALIQLCAGKFWLLVKMINPCLLML